MATGCRDLYQTDYTDRLGSGVWITNRSNRNRLINSQLWTCASLLASRVNTLFDTTTRRGASEHRRTVHCLLDRGDTEPSLPLALHGTLAYKE